MFEDVSTDFGSFRLQPRRTNRQRNNTRGRQRKAKNSNATMNTTDFYNNDQGKNQKKKNRGRRRGRGRGRRRQRKLSAEEVELVENSALSASAPRFNSAYEWQEPMFISPFVASAPYNSKLNPEAAEFVPKNN